MVLDDARHKLIRHYKFKFEELWPRKVGVDALVSLVRSKLNEEHSKLLSKDALWMIFDSSDGSVRDQGNAAAHESSKDVCSIAVLDSSLGSARRSILAAIYYFAHDTEAGFEIEDL
jgi:hypothetical protein